MTKFKIVIPIILVIALAIMLVLFGKGVTQNHDDKFNIVTTFYPVELIVDNLIKDIKDVTSVNISASTGGCAHDYELTSLDMKTIENADLIVINGQDMEHFMEKVTVNNRVVDSSVSIPNSGMSSHIWMDIDNYISQIKTIGNALCTYDTDNCSNYTRNMNEYVNRIEQLRNIFDIKTDKNVAIMHDSFKYYANVGMFSICAEFFAGHEGNYSANDLKNFIKKTNDTNAQILFIDNETYEHNSSLVNAVVNETNAKVYVLDLIVDVEENASQYVEKMTDNINVIKEAVGYVE